MTKTRKKVIKNQVFLTLESAMLYNVAMLFLQKPFPLEVSFIEFAVFPPLPLFLL
jgi:hypothetical protein